MVTPNPSVGIDISGFQDVSAAQGPWLFVCVKATEGPNASPVNPRLSAQWQAISPGVLRGMYHYARPGLSTGQVQGDAFATCALLHGFVPGQDFWQLDCEGGENGELSDSTWEVFARDFCAQASRRLGPKGFLYYGAGFHTQALGSLGMAWWLPSYGPGSNPAGDGQLHALPDGLRPVIHQFTGNPIDQNVIADPVRWASMMTPPIPIPVVTPVTGGVESDMANVKTAVVACVGVHPPLCLFGAVYDAGGPVAGVQATVLGPDPHDMDKASADDWWPGTIDATVRAQARGNHVVLTVRAPNWRAGMSAPQVSVTAVLA